MGIKWKKYKDDCGEFWAAGVYRISKIGRKSYALISVERIKMSVGYSFLAYLDNTLKGAKDEAEIHEMEQKR